MNLATAEPTVGDAVRQLALLCDGAQALDGSGFNKIDARFGRSLAQRPDDDWSPRQLRAAWKMIAKYRGQLAARGIDYDAIPEPPAPEPREQAAKLVATDPAGFALYFPYSRELVADIKALPGARWDKKRSAGFDHSCWTVKADPIAMEGLVNLIVEQDFDLDDGVIERIQELGEQLIQSVAESRAAESNFTVDGLGGELRPFQAAGVAYVVKAERSFIGDEMGLGKTIQALAAVHAKRALPALVICPATLKLNWKKEAEKWLPGVLVVVLNGKPIDLTAIDADVVIINYDILGKWLDQLHRVEWKALVVDESQMVKGHQAQRTENVRELALGLHRTKEKGKRTKSERVAPEIPLRMLLSGTPVLNRPKELLPQLEILGRLDDFGGFWPFVKRYCAAFQGEFGWVMDGHANLEELNTRLRAICYVRREKAEVLKELPPKQRAIVPIALDNRDEYEQTEDDVAGWVAEQAIRNAEFLISLDALPEEERTPAIRAERIRAYQRAQQAEQLVRYEALKQVAAKGKMAACKEWVEEFLESGQKLVLFAHHRNVVAELAHAFDADCITGDTPIPARQAAVDRFQTDPECRLLVCNIQAGGVGITLTAASNVAFMEFAWNPGTMDQAEDRCHRIGQLDSVTAWYLVGAATIDEEICDLIDEKRKVVTASTDGTPGHEVEAVADLNKRLLARKGAK